MSIPLFRLTDANIERIPETAFAAEGLKERSDLQRAIRDNVDIVAPDTFVLADEYSQWDDSRRRIEGLCQSKWIPQRGERRDHDLHETSKTHLREVSAVQPTLAAIELIAAHCDPYSAR